MSNYTFLRKGLLFFYVFLPFLIFSQDLDSENRRKNEIGVDILDLIDGTFQISYERAFGKNFSFNFGVGFKTDGLIKLSGIDGEKIKTNDFTFTGVKFIPEVRYYLNNEHKNRLDGFYFGAYAKHNSFHSDFKGIYTNDAQENYDFLFDAKLRITSVGLMVGYKLPVSKRFSIDFLIAGPGVVWHKYRVENKKDLPDEFYDDLNQALDDYFESLSLEFTLSKVQETIDFVLPSFRYGISLGYNF